ncbi:hypothetical protein CEE37_04805 [candidate division LCP-89 bacterium B3_LCP]|uniref:Outer membrane protein beta-barrel domain-containing protein n=1 Tax=candidate division LCP-89 bacterium B3_LCP TaxID=2012998 RepID=A0A532V437_UNCL8|nr:MAG: hypothetical protein CEE37_04805 [candidate division LCP-89 bacterium B3_LCP]
MKRITSKIIFILLLVCVVIPSQVYGINKIPIKLKVFWTSGYDDNILKYSPRDLDRFENNTENYPSEIATSDDWINSFGLRVYHDFKLGKYFRWRPYYSGRLSMYASNSLKNGQSHFFLSRLTYRYRIYLYLQYSYMPGYYLRIYQDRDTNQYQSCNFNIYRPSVRIKYRHKPFEVDVRYGKEYIYYNEYFTEYDSEAYFTRVSGAYESPLGFDLSLGYEFKVSDNIGFDQTSVLGVTLVEEDTEYGDSSYEENRYLFTLDYKLPVKSAFDWSVGIDFDRRLRYYQSGQPFDIDKFHAGRKDRRDRIETTVTCTPSSNLNVGFSFIYDQRRTESPDPIVSSIKNFDHRTIELTMIYTVF